MYNIVVSIKLSRDILNEIDRYADMIGVSRSELIRRAIRHILNNDIHYVAENKIRNNLGNESVNRTPPRKNYISIELE
ncbi:MAG: ribbon-helix-helix domain-containing protein [Sulfolobales archaeon]|jgi:metal-responsive CopG/Arc/MetJ family transcriptional regulator